MEHMEKETIIKILAICVFVLSSAAIVRMMYRDIFKRRRLSVSCHIGKVVDKFTGISTDKYLVYIITNTSKEPVVLTHIGGTLKNNQFLVIPNNKLPRVLQPNEYIIDHYADLSILKMGLKHLWAIDSSDRKHKAPHRHIKKIRKEFLALNRD
jgi:hypothetical protein